MVRRGMLLVTVALLMVAIMMAGAIPAFAVKPPPQHPPRQNQYVCGSNDDVQWNVPPGQVAKWQQMGYFCTPQATLPPDYPVPKPNPK
jgi:hypothetical protein